MRRSLLIHRFAKSSVRGTSSDTAFVHNLRSVFTSERRSIVVCQPVHLAQKPDEGSRMSNHLNAKATHCNSTVNKCTVVKQETVHKEKWLSLERLTYRDPTGQERTWESVERTTKSTARGAADGVALIAILNRLLHYDCLVLVKQFRPPLKAYTIEFPAGLIDPAESVEEAALRELKEETGYAGSIISVSPSIALDPGVSSSTVNLVHVQIDGNDQDNIHPECNLDEGEFTEVLLIPVNEVLERLQEMAKEKDVIVDAHVYMYASTLRHPHLGMVSTKVTSADP